MDVTAGLSAAASGSDGFDFPVVDEFEVDPAVARIVIHVLDLESPRVE